MTKYMIDFIIVLHIFYQYWASTGPVMAHYWPSAGIIPAQYWPGIVVERNIQFSTGKFK